MPTGRGAGQEPPTTPVPLVQASALLLAEPDRLAVPVQTVSLNAVPLNVICPLNVPPLTVPVTLPVQATSSPRQVPVTLLDDCRKSMEICSVRLFDEPNVPVHVPAIST